MITIREVNANDFESWSLMRAILWPKHTVKEHFAEVTKFLPFDTFHAWIALSGDKYVGFAEASIRPHANGCKSRPVVFLEGIWVDELYRKQGLGRRFIQAVEEWARSKEIYEIGSDAEQSNHQSHACHKKWGFEETERVIYYRKRVRSAQ